MLLRRRAAYFLCLLTLASCQWSPVYAPKDVSSLPAISIDAPADKLSRTLRHLLEDALPNAVSEKDTAPWSLSISPTVQRYPIGIEDDGQASRFNVVAASRIIIRKDGHILAEDTVKRIASYAVVDSDFATYLAQEQAEERVLVMLSEAIRDRVLHRLSGAKE